MIYNSKPSVGQKMQSLLYCLSGSGGRYIIQTVQIHKKKNGGNVFLSNIDSFQLFKWDNKFIYFPRYTLFYFKLKSKSTTNL